MADSHSNIASETTVTKISLQHEPAHGDASAHAAQHALKDAHGQQTKVPDTHVAVAADSNVNNDCVDGVMTSLTADMDPSELKDKDTEKDASSAPVSVTMTMTATMTIRESSVDGPAPPPPVLPPQQVSPPLPASPVQQGKAGDNASTEVTSASGSKSKAAKDRENKERGATSHPASSPMKGA